MISGKNLFSDRITIHVIVTIENTAEIQKIEWEMYKQNNSERWIKIMKSIGAYPPNYVESCTKQLWKKFIIIENVKIHIKKKSVKYVANIATCSDITYE